MTREQQIDVLATVLATLRLDDRLMVIVGSARGSLLEVEYLTAALNEWLSSDQIQRYRRNQKIIDAL
jgi:hypothetical protein